MATAQTIPMRLPEVVERPAKTKELLVDVEGSVWVLC